MHSSESPTFNELSREQPRKRPRLHRKAKDTPRKENEGSFLLRQAEAQDLANLLEICNEAHPVVFQENGSPSPPFVPVLDGLWHFRLPDSLMTKFIEIHNHIVQSIGRNSLVPWAGVGADAQRKRGFGLMGPNAYEKLRQQVTLHAMEKTGKDACLDEQANWKATCILKGTMLDKARTAAQELIDGLRDNDHKNFDIGNGINKGVLLPADLSVDQLIAYQPNLHLGARHLAAHLDWPLHEGFGKVIVTIAIRESATILILDGATEEQTSYKFKLSPGEAYILSGRVRNECLHAVLAEEGSSTPSSSRESLNLRFGIHTTKEAHEQVTRHWPEGG